MPTYIKAGYWITKDKAPKSYLDLNLLITQLAGGGGGDTSEWANVTGTRAGDNLFVSLGDFDTTTSGARVDIDQALDRVRIYGQIGQDGSIGGGTSAASFGISNSANSYGEFVVGVNATTPTPALNGDISFNSSDRVFAIGMGLNGLSRADAMEVFKDGNITFNNLSNSDIDSAGGDSAVTKSWVEQVGNRSLVYEATFTGAQIQGVAVPIELISAPGPGRRIVPIQATFELDYGGTAFDFNGLGDEALQISGITSGNTIFIFRDTEVNGTADFNAQYEPQGSATFTQGLNTNEGLELNSGIGGVTQGNSDVRISIMYYVIDALT